MEQSIMELIPENVLIQIRNLKSEINFEKNRIRYWESLNGTQQKIIRDRYIFVGPPLQEISSIEMFSFLHNEDNELVAIVKVATEIGIIFRSTLNDLLELINEQTEHNSLSENIKSTKSVKPKWDSNSHSLSYKGLEVLSLQQRRKSSYSETLLAAFQKADWPEQIKNPLGSNPERIKTLVKYLNKISTKTIKFSTKAGGKYISWEIT